MIEEQRFIIKEQKFIIKEQKFIIEWQKFMIKWQSFIIEVQGFLFERIVSEKNIRNFFKIILLYQAEFYIFDVRFMNCISKVL
jgi:hypothetical protein